MNFNVGDIVEIRRLLTIPGKPNILQGEQGEITSINEYRSMAVTFSNNRTQWFSCVAIGNWLKSPMQIKYGDEAATVIKNL